MDQQTSIQAIEGLVGKIIEGNEDIRKLNQMINQAYVGKYHAVQVLEKNARNIEKNEHIKEIENKQLNSLKFQLDEEELKKYERLKKMDDYRKELIKQMENKKENEMKSLQAFKEDKERISQEINKIISGELR